jgi:small subunit ribosomal protein S9
MWPAEDEMTKTSDRAYATGRRKESVARVWLSPGEGTFTVNGRAFEDYFPAPTRRMVIQQPLALVERLGGVDVKATVKGGGVSGQAGAVLHAIARALVKMEEEYRPTLRKAGFLTRDAREVERKKYGQPGARKNFQFSKR